LLAWFVPSILASIVTPRVVSTRPSRSAYTEVERQIVDALPEIRPAAEFYWKTLAG
jgi:hypothetical protein